jgi:hypothetical protein
MNWKIWKRKKGPPCPTSVKPVYTAEMNRLMEDAIMSRPIHGCALRIEAARGPELDDVALRCHIVNDKGEDLCQVFQHLIKFDDSVTIGSLHQPFNIKITQI